MGIISYTHEIRIHVKQPVFHGVQVSGRVFWKLVATIPELIPFCQVERARGITVKAWHRHSCPPGFSVSWRDSFGIHRVEVDQLPLFHFHRDVSKNRGKNWKTQNGWFISWKTLLKWMIWGPHPYFWKHSYNRGWTHQHNSVGAYRAPWNKDSVIKGGMSLSQKKRDFWPWHIWAHSQLGGDFLRESSSKCLKKSDLGTIVHVALFP